MTKRKRWWWENVWSRLFPFKWEEMLAEEEIQRLREELQRRLASVRKEAATNIYGKKPLHWAEYNIVFVLAGNHDQYLKFLLDRGFSRTGSGIDEKAQIRYIYVSQPTHMQGYDYRKVLRVERTGTYWHNPLWNSEALERVENQISA